MIEHVSLPVASVPTARLFYERVLEPLGYKVSKEFPDAVGFMEGGHTSFWVVQKEKVEPVHVAFRARDKLFVDDFYDKAMQDNGAPGYRAHYGPGYYAAFILDLDGHNIETVWFEEIRESDWSKE
jgi:catechol 2,3-dioxygenase-like lactoylglutathione lyase family enzyme